MGIRGLKGFIEKNEEKLKRQVLIRNIPLVIDGMNFVYNLFIYSALLPHLNRHALCGGDYTRFADSVRHFFTLMDRIGVKPVVVLDGGVDPSGKKLRTLLERIRQTLDIIVAINETPDTDSAAPAIGTLSVSLFVEVLTELSVPHIQASYEADEVIARIANQLKCPVLSDDSDFFIFDLKGGVICCEDLVLGSLEMEDIPTGECYGFECDLYIIDNLIEYFPGLKTEVLPVFATLMGNDYVERGLFPNMFDVIPRHSIGQGSKYLSLEFDGRHQRVVRLLDRLRNWSADELIETIGQHLSDEAMDLLRTSIDSYRNDMSADDRVVPDLTDLSKLLPDRDQSLPEWFVKDFQLCRVSATLMNVIKLKYEFLYVRVDDHSLPSSYDSGRELRQYLFALLRLDAEDDKPIVIYDRKFSEMANYELKPLLRLPNGRLLPDLHRIKELSVSARRLFMSDILSIEPTLLRTIENIFRDFETNETPGAVFLIILLKYYLSKVNHPVWLEFVCALLTVIITSGHIGHQIRNPFVRLNEIEGKELVDSLQRFNGCPVNSITQPFQPPIPHFFNEYQDIVRMARDINALFDSPYKTRSYLFCLNGVFIYNLTIELSSHHNPKRYMTDVLSWRSTVAVIYETLIKAVIDKSVANKVVKSPKLNKPRMKSQLPKMSFSELNN